MLNFCILGGGGLVFKSRRVFSVRFMKELSLLVFFSKMSVSVCSLFVVLFIICDDWFFMKLNGFVGFLFLVVFVGKWVYSWLVIMIVLCMIRKVCN